MVDARFRAEQDRSLQRPGLPFPGVLCREVISGGQDALTPFSNLSEVSRGFRCGFLEGIFRRWLKFCFGDKETGRPALG